MFCDVPPPNNAVPDFPRSTGGSSTSAVLPESRWSAPFAAARNGQASDMTSRGWARSSSRWRSRSRADRLRPDVGHLPTKMRASPRRSASAQRAPAPFAVRRERLAVRRWSKGRGQNVPRLPCRNPVDATRARSSAAVDEVRELSTRPVAGRAAAPSPDVLRLPRGRALAPSLDVSPRPS